MHVMNTKRLYQIKDVARLAAVSVRTLHHYDDIGLLSPSQRSAAGYRLYSHEDLLRLQQILIQRELGLPLEAIKRSLDDPEFDRCAALKQQRQEITARLERIQAMLQAIDTALGALAQGEDGMESLGNEVQSLFGGFDPSQYEEEAKRRWGESAAWKESQRRTQRYSTEDWKRYAAEADALMREAAQLFQSGTTADSEPAKALAERHRLSIERWFYPCSPTMHAKLADLYESDARFTSNIDKFAPGLTPWLSAAIRANADT